MTNQSRVTVIAKYDNMDSGLKFGDTYLATPAMDDTFNINGKLVPVSCVRIDDEEISALMDTMNRLWSALHFGGLRLSTKASLKANKAYEDAKKDFETELMRELY